MVPEIEYMQCFSYKGRSNGVGPLINFIRLASLNGLVASVYHVCAMS